MKTAFVTGWPVNHSKSPLLHGYWISQYGLDAKYVPHAVAPEEFPVFLHSFPDLGFCGGNVTIPHKEAAFQSLATIDPAAAAIGAVNTVWVEDETIRGGNTDAYGFSGNLDDFAPEWRSGKIALVLGAGGASRAIIYALKEAGFSSIRIANRTLSRAEGLAKEFGQVCQAYELENLRDLANDVDLVVNTTSLGMTGNAVLDPSFLDIVSSDAIVTDIVYTPLMTPLLEKAQERGLKTVDGLGMLLHQAVPGFEKWFGLRPEVTLQLRKHILEAE